MIRRQVEPGPLLRLQKYLLRTCFCSQIWITLAASPRETFTHGLQVGFGQKKAPGVRGAGEAGLFLSLGCFPDLILL